MSDSYQAVYDAVRSRISGCDVGTALADAARHAFDISWTMAILKQEALVAIDNFRRPSVQYRPAIYMDGNAWCALYGENLQDGVAGFGDTPEKAMRAFDIAWAAKPPPAQGGSQ